MIPFLVAIPIFLIPTLRMTCSYARVDIEGAKCGDSLWAFLAAYIVNPVEIMNHISWLWYLPAMFVDFMLTYPLLKWTKRRQAGLPFGRGDVEAVVLQLITSCVWMFISFNVMGDNS